MIVAKFGGTSVSSKERILTLCNIVKNVKGGTPVVVVSALSGVTDLLLSLPGLSKQRSRQKLQELKAVHQDLISDLFKDEDMRSELLKFTDQQIDDIAELISLVKLPKESLNRLVSFGEIISSYIIAQVLNSKGINAKQVVSTRIIITENLESSDFLPQQTKQKVKKILLPLIQNEIVPVVTGFIASTKSGYVTTLGRGGSDYTASIIGFCLGAEEIQIWTDVDGVLTADPRLVKNAKLVPVVSYSEASELATFGARVLHPRTIRPAVKAGIPVRVLNTFNIKSQGSLIIKEHEISGLVRAISSKKKITLVNISSSKMLLQKGFLAQVFSIFAENNISINLVSVSEVSISVTLDNTENLKNVVKELAKNAHVSVISDLGSVSLIGEEVTSSTGTIRRIFEILEKEKILAKMVSLGATNINISIVVDSDKVERAVQVLHSRLLLKQNAQELLKNDTIATK